MALQKTTTFIPKRPMVGESKAPRTIGILNVLGTALFFVSLLLAVGAFVYERYTEVNIQEKEASIVRIQKDFEPETLEDIKKIDVRLRSARELLDGHVVISPLFLLLESLTLRNVRYTDFAYTVDDDDVIVVNMNGHASSYRTIANQSILFGERKDYISDHIFSDFNLLPSGQVSFGLQLVINTSQSFYGDHLGAFSGRTSFPANTFPDTGGGNIFDGSIPQEPPIFDQREQDVINIFNTQQ